MKPQLLVDAVETEDGKLSARCPYCTFIHTWDATGKTPTGGVLYVTSQCDTPKAFEHDGTRRRLALRMPR